MTSRQKQCGARPGAAESIGALAASVSAMRLRWRCAVLACVGACCLLAFAPEAVRDRAWASSRAPDRAPQSRLQVAQTTDDAAATATKKPSEQTDQTAKVPASSDHPDDASLFILRHEGAVTRVAFEPSGDRLVTSARDGTARIWDANTGEPIGKPLQTLVAVYAAVFDPKGERVVTASWDKTARIWDSHTGEPIGKPLEHDDIVRDVAFDPKGERIVTASEDKTARIWDAKTGEPIGKTMTHDGGVNTAAFAFHRETHRHGICG